MYSRVKNWKQAEENINKALELATKQEDKDYVIFVQGSIYERQKKYDLAEESFHKVLADDPKNAMTLNYLGYMLADRGTRVEEALGYIRRAVALDPQNGAYLDSLGWAYYRWATTIWRKRTCVAPPRGSATIPPCNSIWANSTRRTGRLKLAATHWERASGRVEQEPFLPKWILTTSPRCRKNWKALA